jgi:hypothetical protein
MGPASCHTANRYTITFCSESFGRRSLPSRNTFCARLTESSFPDLVGPLVLAAMNNDVLPDFTLPRFYVANLIEGMRKRLQVSTRHDDACTCAVSLSSKFEPPRSARPHVASLSSAECAVDGRRHKSRGHPQNQRALPSSRAPRIRF